MSITLTKRQQAEQAIKDKRLIPEKRDPATSDEQLALLTAAMKKCVEPGSDDDLSLEVRRGVTFQGYEVFLRDRVLTIKPELVASAIKNGKLDTLAQSYIDRLASRLFAGQEPSIAKYRVVDVERERSNEIEDAFRLAYGEEYAKQCIDFAVSEAEKLAEGWKKPMRPATKLRLVRQSLKNILVNNIKESMSKETQNA